MIERHTIRGRRFRGDRLGREEPDDVLSNRGRQPNDSRPENFVMKIAILIPVYNDWASLSKLLARLNEVLRGRAEQFYLLLVDDASDDPPPSSLPNFLNVFLESKLLR